MINEKILERVISRACPDCLEVTVQKLFEVTKVDIEDSSIYVRYTCTNCSDIHEYYNIGFSDSYCRALAHMLDTRKRLLGLLE